MMILAKIVYWLMSFLAALLLALTAVLLVDIAYGEEMPNWWLHALSLALLALCVWFVGWIFRYCVWRIWGSTATPGQTVPKS
jgi:heme/copper-type cytochrome/quinol oxidase subunit 2